MKTVSSFVVIAILVVATSCNKIYFRKIKKESTFGESGSALGQLKDPSEIRTDGTYLYVSDHGNNRVQRFDINTHKAKDWLGYDNGSWGWHTTKKVSEQHDWYPDQIYIQGDTLYACSLNEIIKVQISTGSYLAEISFDSKISLVMDFAVDSKGNLFVMNDYTIYKYNSNGLEIKDFGGYGNADGQIIGQSPLYMEFDKSDNLYVDGNKLVKYNDNGEFIKNLISDQHYTATSICFDGDKLYHVMGKLVEFDLDGKVLKRWGDHNEVWRDYCVKDGRLFSIYSDNIIEWSFKPE